MAIFVIPTTSNQSNFEQLVTLDGEQYRFRFLWNDRVARWFLSVEDLDGALLITGRKLCADMPWAAHETIDDVPPGDIWTMSVAGSDDDPALRDLGARSFMLYVGGQ